MESTQVTGIRYYREAAVRLLAAVSILHMLLLIFHFATCSFFTTRESYKNAPAIFRWARTLTSCSFQNAEGCLFHAHQHFLRCFHLLVKGQGIQSAEQGGLDCTPPRLD